MSTLVEIAYNIITPIFLIIGLSVLVDRRFAPDPKALSRLIVYLFTPFLVLDGISNTELKAGEAGQLVISALFMSFGVALIAWLIARAAHFDRKLESGFMVSSVLVNAGNYGIPLNQFAFGDAGAERAVIFFATTVVVSNTFGVFLASRGAASTRQALLNVLLIPLPYAALLGVFINVGDVTIPAPFQRAITLLADASNPCMLVVLGVQLSRASMIRGRLKPILLASSMRLVVAPLIMLIPVVALGMTGLTRQVALVEAAMPTAVIGGVLATEFGSDSEFVTGTILLSTLLSILTLSVLLSWVM